MGKKFVIVKNVVKYSVKPHLSALHGGVPLGLGTFWSTHALTNHTGVPMVMSSFSSYMNSLGLVMQLWFM